MALAYKQLRYAYHDADGCGQLVNPTPPTAIVTFQSMNPTVDAGKPTQPRLLLTSRRATIPQGIAMEPFHFKLSNSL